MPALNSMTDRASWSQLIAGIVLDATRLFAIEIELAKLEIRADIQNTKSLVAGIAAGAVIAFLGVAQLGVAAPQQKQSRRDQEPAGPDERW